MKQEILNLHRVRFETSTTYAGRKTGTPLMSISKACYLTFNIAFSKKYLSNVKTKLFIGYLKQNNKPYIVLSKTQNEEKDYYSLSIGNSGNFQCGAPSLARLLGKKNSTIRYKVIPVKTNKTGTKAFRIVKEFQDEVKIKIIGDN